MVPEHAEKGHHARASGDELHRVVTVWPHEVATDRPAKLELVACAQLIGEIGRHLAVVQALHDQVEVVLLRW